MTNYWKIAPGHDGRFWPIYRDDGVIGVGWNAEGDLDKKKDLSSIPTKLGVFYEDIHKGHKIIACHGHFILGIGTISRDHYEFNKDYDEDGIYCHTKPVDWKMIFWEPVDAGTFKLSKNKVDAHIKNLFGSRVYKTAVVSLGKKGIAGKAIFDRIAKLTTNKKSYLLANIREWDGIVNAPQSEQELIVLFSKLSKYLYMKIEYVSTQFPDADIRRKEYGSWKTKSVEFELNASGFISHHKKFIKERKPCDMVICWKDDIKEKMKNLKERDTRKSKKEFGKWKDILRRINSGKLEVLELRKELKNQIQSRR